MKKTLRGLFISLLSVSVLTCDEDHKNEPRFLEGQEIPNTRYFKPLESSFAPSADMPVIAPNGQWIAYRFTDTAPTGHGLYRMNLHTYEKTLIVNDFSARNHDWSSDNQWLVFNIDAQIYKIKANGDSLTQLTFDGRNFFPDWSPDGKKIAYDNTICGSGGSPPPPNSCGILVMNADGSHKVRISDGREPDWHPSGNQIIRWGPIVMNANGSGSKLLNEIPAVSPQYSPDGSRILFWNDEGIWIMNSDGTNPRRILPNQHYNDKHELIFAAVQPSWHPDSRHIVYLHLNITKHIPCDDKDGEIICPDFDPIEYYSSFHLLNVDSALAASNL